MQVLLLKYGEIALKGLNRAKFENLLIRNIRAVLAKCAQPLGIDAQKFVIEREQSAMTLWYNGDSDNENDAGFELDNVIPALSKVFGISVINSAVRTDKDIEKIKEAALQYIAPVLQGKKSFGVAGKRSDKTFALTSPEIARIIGDVLFENHNCNVDNIDNIGDIKVDLKKPEVLVTVEIRLNGAFIHSSEIRARGAGGMPVGSSGTGLLLLSGGIDSPIAGYMTARRGMKIAAVHFTSEPYTSEASREKVIRLAKILEDYAGAIKFYTVSLTEIQENIKKYCDNDYTTIIMRRFMMQIAEKIAHKYYYDCLITGESLGQVASQTIQAIHATNEGITMPILRPCIGLDKYQIIEIAEQIGTYETSIEPYDDCCAIFTPKHPVTRPKLHKVLEEEARINQSGMSKSDLIDRAIAEIVKPLR